MSDQATTGGRGEIGVDELRKRLAAAEDVCLMFGWSGVRRETSRERVAGRLWRNWADMVGDDFLSPKAHPDLDNLELVEEGAVCTFHRPREQWCLLPIDDPIHVREDEPMRSGAHVWRND